MRASGGPANLFGLQRRPADVSVFAVEDDTVQVTWRHLAPGAHRLSGEAAGRTVTTEVDADGGPGTADLGGLTPGAVVTVALDGQPLEQVTTLVSPPGEELSRFATVSDTHIGGNVFGALPAIVLDPLAHDECLRGAVEGAGRWGATLLAVKGDITEDGLPEEWERAVGILASARVPVVAVPGNHDVWQDAADGVAAFAAAGLRLVVGGVAHHDLPGIRVVLVDTTVPGRHHGTVAPHTEAVCDLVHGSGPAVILLHQHLQRWNRTVNWPPGIPAHEGRAFLDAVAGVNPDVVVSSGHTHRHRARRHGPLTITEVGSPKDHPGTWAGYVVHEGGLRQVVRRVGTPAGLDAAERTARTLGGAWERWSPGPLEARCFTVPWVGGGTRRRRPT